MRGGRSLSTIRIPTPVAAPLSGIKDRLKLMKIVCQACETSYQIDDRQVTGTGRVFRISCRSCKEAILVDGLDGQGTGLSGWYLSTDGDRQGPMELDQLRARLREDGADPSALIWSNGMDRWRPASDVDEIVAPWEAETVQSDDQEEEGETTLISLDEISRVHAELEARDAPLLGDEEVELVEESGPPDLPVFEPHDAVAETVQRSSSEDLEPGEPSGGKLPPFEPPEAVAETVQRSSSDERARDEHDSDERARDEDDGGEVPQTLIFKLDPSTLGTDPGLPEASEVIPSSDTGEDVHEMGSSAAALFRLDDLDLGNEAKVTSPKGQQGVGLTSSSLFVGDDVRSTDPAAVRARPRTVGTVTTNVPIVKKRRTWIRNWALATVGVVAGIALTTLFNDAADETPDSVAQSESVTSKSPVAPPDKEAVVAKPEATPEKSPQLQEPPLPAPATAVVPQTEEKPAPATAVAPQAEVKPAVAAVRSSLSAAERKIRRSEAKARTADAQAGRAQARAARRALRNEPMPNFGRSAKRSKKERASKPRASKPRAGSKVENGSSSVNDLLGQLKNKPGKPGEEELQQLPQKLSASEVRGTLRKRQSRFKGCYRKMVNRPEGAVTVKTRFTIVSSGRVSKALIVSAGDVDGTVQSCILETVRGAKFPRFRAAEMIVNYPILLR